MALLTFTTTDDQSQLGADAGAGDLAVMSREDGPRYGELC